MPRVNSTSFVNISREELQAIDDLLNGKSLLLERRSFLIKKIGAMIEHTSEDSQYALVLQGKENGTDKQPNW